MDSATWPELGELDFSQTEITSDRGFHSVCGLTPIPKGEDLSKVLFPVREQMSAIQPYVSLLLSKLLMSLLAPPVKGSVKLRPSRNLLC